jgi:lipopolysaccharide/colanic/teichoic acid biosynthesis glycosyltransferase
VFAVVALLIKLSEPRAPVMFPQVRTGRGGVRFRMYKFRTMVRNAEQLKQQYAHLNELTWPDFKIENDPRVTRIGRFLRRTSLDELPQVWNVLRREMSWVGPRPTFPPRPIRSGRPRARRRARITGPGRSPAAAPA